MREIKFRAYSDLSNKMHYPKKNEDLWMFLRRIYGMIKEQYTGLKDKNGVEIYEGDVIKYNSNKWEIVYMIDSENSSAGYYCKLNNTTFYCFSKTMKKIEVIGNIHENKDLLT